MSVTIPLTRGYVAIVDDEDADEVSKYRWRAWPTGRSVYAATTTNTKEGRCHLYMHRLILLDGKQTGTIVDHIDGNGLNNCKANLRECTIADNTKNRKVPMRTNTSGYTGVVWKKDRRAWIASIIANGKRTYLGYFKVKEDAIEARRKAEQEYFGEFAPNA